MLGKDIACVGQYLERTGYNKVVNDAWYRIKKHWIEEHKAICNKSSAPCADFISAFQAVSQVVNKIAVEKGWWKNDRNDGELIALMHSELSEALEGLRHGNPASNHIQYSAVEEELADVIIRIMDYAVAKKHRVAEALIAKVAFNRGREFMHGKKF